MASADKVGDNYSAVFFMDGSDVSRQMRASEFEAFLDGYVGLSDLADTNVKAVFVLISTDIEIRSLVFFRIYFDDEGQADVHWNMPVEELALKGAKGPDLGGGPIRLVCRSQCPESANADELWDPDMAPGRNHFQAIRRAVEANGLRFRKVDPPSEADIPLLAADLDTGNDRARLAQLIREQRLRIKTLQSVHRDALADLQRENHQEVQALRNEMMEVQQRYERQKLSNEQLMTRLAERNEQYLEMQEQENDDLRHQTSLENSVLEHLQHQSVFLVAYHPGMGHVTLPYSDIEAYFQNPVAYAAGRCGVNEPAYRQWLGHHEHPVCQYESDSGGKCQEPIMRVSQPSEFRSGVDDRCERHQLVESLS